MKCRVCGKHEEQMGELYVRTGPTDDELVRSPEVGCAEYWREQTEDWRQRVEEVKAQRDEMVGRVAASEKMCKELAEKAGLAAAWMEAIVTDGTMPATCPEILYELNFVLTNYEGLEEEKDALGRD